MNFIQLKSNLEIAWDSLKQHKSRNILTGFGVAWGIFILIILVAAGQGLQEGIMRIFGNYAQNSLWVYGGYIETGMGKKKQILFDRNLIENLQRVYPEIKAISAQKSFPGHLISNDLFSGVFNLTATDIDYFSIKLLKLSSGRTFNKLDKMNNRKVAVIGEHVAEELFPNESSIGKFIQIKGTWFKVIGQLKQGSLFDQMEQRKVFIPFQCLRESIISQPTFSEVGLVLDEHQNIDKFEDFLKNYLSRRYLFSPSDKKALYIFNRKDQIKSFKTLFAGLHIFLWSIGISLLITGMVGISNTMIIVVQERTKEIGIRKAMGAKAKQVLFMILTESIAITLISGIIGLLVGILLSALINLLIAPSSDDTNHLIQGFSINLSVAFSAITVLILSGSIAGLFPARKAAEITPVEAINHETV